MNPSHVPSPALSFIIPACNAQETLHATLTSVSNQSRPDWEAIVIDDGSSDCTAEVASSFPDPRVRLVRQANRGLAGARNTGLLHASGTWVTFLDADDLVRPEFARRMLASIGTNDLVACDYELVGPACQPLGWVQHVSESDLNWDRLILNNPLAVTIVARHAALPRIALGTHTFDESLPVLEDWDLWLRLSASGTRWATPVPETLVEIRLRPGSLSQGVERMYQTGLRVIRERARSLTEHRSAERQWNLLHAARFLASRDPEPGTKILDEITPLSPADWSMLASMYLSACQRASLTGPSEVELHRPEWAEQVSRLLPPPLAQPLLLALDLVPASWRRVGQDFVRSLHPGQLPVIFGVGSNGKLALAGACEEASQVFWIDDRKGATVPAMPAGRCVQLSREQLTPRHVILVTPSAHESISRELRARGLRVYERSPDSLAAAPATI